MRNHEPNGTDAPGLGRIPNLPAVATANDLGLDTVFEYGKNSTQHGQGGQVACRCLGSWCDDQSDADGLCLWNSHRRAKERCSPHYQDRKRKWSSGQEPARNQPECLVVTTDKMTNTMLGTQWYRVNAAPYGYTMAGKTGTTETSFNKDLSGDQWVIGYTPDVVISHWLAS